MYFVSWKHTAATAYMEINLLLLFDSEGQYTDPLETNSSNCYYSSKQLPLFDLSDAALYKAKSGVFYSFVGAIPRKSDLAWRLREAAIDSLPPVCTPTAEWANVGTGGDQRLNLWPILVPTWAQH